MNLISEDGWIPVDLNCVSEMMFFIYLLEADSKLPDRRHTPSRFNIMIYIYWRLIVNFKTEGILHLGLTL